MALIFHIPGVVPLYNGEPQPSSTLTFSLTGTSTLTDTYTDDELSVAHANPVVADSAGYFEPIYLNPAVAYRCVWKTSGGTTLKTWDLANDVLETTGTFTITLTGISGTDPTGTARWSKSNNTVTLFIPLLTGTSDATSSQLTGVPSSIYPTRTQTFLMVCQDNGGAFAAGLGTLSSAGTFNVFPTPNGGNWTGSGTKSVNSVTVTYSLL